jgi:hypothetical protein
MNGFTDENTQIGIDFDGVIHKNSKGFYDGTIYDDPVEDANKFLELISKKYDVVIYTCKARQDRGLVNGKTGVELIWEWLHKHGLNSYVKKVTSEKPRAVCYIEDKSYRFDNWLNTINRLKEDKIL